MMAKENIQPHQNTLQLLETILEHTHMLIAYMDPQFNFIRVNRAYAEADERAPEFFPGKNHFNLYPNEDNQMIFQRVVDTGKAYFAYEKPFEYPEHPERSVSYWDWSLVPTKDAKGLVTGLVFTLADVTERVKAQEKIRQNQIRYRAVSELTSDLAYAVRVEPDGEFVLEWATEALKNIANYPPDALTNLDDWLALVHHEDRGIIQRHNQRLLSGQPDTCEFRILNSEGHVRWLQDHGRPEWDETKNRVVRIFAAAKDITEHKIAERALQKANLELEKRVRERTADLLAANKALRNEVVERQRAESRLGLLTLAMETAANGIIITDRNANITWANPAFCKMSGYALQEVIGQNTRLLKSGHHKPKFYAQFWKTINSGQVWQGEMINRRKDGQTYMEEQTVTPVLGSHGEITHFIAIKQDITDRKQAQQAIENERQRLFTLLNELPAIVYLKDPDYKIRFANQQFVSHFGAPSGEFCYEIVRGLNRPCENCPTRDVLRDQTPRKTERHFPGGYIYQLYDYPFMDVDGTELVLQLGIDITEREQVQAELEKSNLELLALSQSERAQRQLAEGLLQASIALNSSLDLDEVLEHILTLIQRVIPYSAAAVMLVEDDVLRLVRERGMGDSPIVQKARTEGFLLTAYPLFEITCRDARTVFIPDTQDSEGFESIEDLDWLRSVFAAPLLSGDQTVGLIALLSDQPGFFAPQMIARLEGFAAHSALAIHNARLYQDELRARHTAETLSAASLALTQTLQLDCVLETLIDYIDRLVPYDSGMILLLEEHDKLRKSYARGHEEPYEKQASQETLIDIHDYPVIETMLQEKKPLLIEDVSHYADWKSITEKEHVRNWMGIPLLAGGKVTGIFCAAKRQPGFFTQEHMLLAEALVRQATVGVQNALLFEQVRAGNERLQALSRRLVEVQESERRYVARELHDEASQALSSLMVNLRLLKGKTNQPEAILAGIDEMKRSLESVMENLHRLAMNLRPASLDHLGLVATLRQHAQWIQEQYSFQVQFESVGIVERLPAEVETALYRITQEALANILRHAKATQAGILLEKRDDKIVLIVEDNGVGFDPSLLESNDRLGIFGMRERAEMLGAALSIESTKGMGTTVFVEVPHDNPHPDRG